MARTPSTRSVALKIACDAKQSMATRLQAALTAKPYLSDAKFAQLLRRLIAAGRRGPVIRECLRLLSEIEQREQVNRIFADEKRRLQQKEESKI
jgi:hypothetical protein